MRKLLFLILLLSACATPTPAPQRLAAETQAITATNTAYSVGTEFVRIYQTPVPTCAACFFIPLGTLTPTPQGINMTDYITTTQALLYITGKNISGG